MDFLFPHCTRNYLHTSTSILSNFYFVHPTISRWKQSCMPTEETFVSNWKSVVLCCIKHHFHNTIDITRRIYQSRYFKS